MSLFRVGVTDQAANSIEEYRQYIAERSGLPGVAARWVDSVYDKLETLRYMPTRYEIASEGARCSYEVRRMPIGMYIALYHIDESTKTVSILAFRHGARLPRRGDLPDDPKG